MARAKTALAWGGQWQRLHSLKEGVAGAKTVLPQGGAGRGKDCAPSGKKWQGQRLCSLRKGVTAAKTMIPRGREWQGQRLHSLREGIAGARTVLPQGRGNRGKDCTPSGRSGRIYWRPQLFDVTLGGHFIWRFMVTYQLTVIILLLSKKTRNLRLNILNFFVYCVMNVTTTPF